MRTIKYGVISLILLPLQWVNSQNNYSDFALSIGNKWFYNYYSSVSQNGFVTREITDTLADGRRVVLVTNYFKNETSQDTEYWQVSNGDFYFSDPTWAETPHVLAYIDFLAADSIDQEGPQTNSWHMSILNYFGHSYTCQTCSWSYIHTGGAGFQTIVGKGIGLIFYSRYSWNPADTGNFYNLDDSIKLAGFLNNGILLGDSSNYILNVSKTTVTIKSFILQQNFPNPFNPSTVISYELPTIGAVRLEVYDILGRKIETLVSERQNAGSYSVTFNASNLSSGVYFYRLTAGSFLETKKLILIK